VSRLILVFKFSALGMQNSEIANQKLKLFVLFVLFVVKRSDEILCVHEIRMREKFNTVNEVTKKRSISAICISYLLMDVPEIPRRFYV